MKAVTLSGPGRTEYKGLEDLVLDKPGWVRIRVRSVGLCGSDIQKINSEIEPSTYLRSNILGHELAGEITEVGDRVNNVRVGDRITANPLIPCYRCQPCQRGSYGLCENLLSIGKALPGAFAEEVLVPAENVRKLKDKISFDEASLTDVVAVALHSYHLAGSPKMKNILIHGDGPVGLVCTQILKNNRNIIDVIGKHHQYPVELSGGVFIPLGAANELPPKNYDIIIECVGRRQEETLNQSARLIRPSGTIVVNGVFEVGYKGSLVYRDLFIKEATLRGSNSYGLWHGNSEFDQALGLIEQGCMDMSRIITHVLPLDRFNEGLELVNNKEKSKAIKIIYKP
jgi:threonine dehydrogenase-like Zn-dependent dehydrogenase